MALPDQCFGIPAVDLQDLIDHVVGLYQALLVRLAKIYQAQAHVIQDGQLEFIIDVAYLVLLKFVFVELKTTQSPDVNFNCLIVI